MVTVAGPPGIGKSRLIRELVHDQSEPRVVVGRCLPYGEGITYWPLAEIVRHIDPIADILQGHVDAHLIAARIEGAIGAGEAVGNPEETAWAFRRLFEALAEKTPLVVVLDDIHWADWAAAAGRSIAARRPAPRVYRAPRRSRTRRASGRRRRWAGPSSRRPEQPGCC